MSENPLAQIYKLGFLSNLKVSGRPIHRFADASADASADGHRPMVPSVFSKPSADGFYFKNHRFSEKMAEKDHLGNILRK